MRLRHVHVLGPLAQFTLNSIKQQVLKPNCLRVMELSMALWPSMRFLGSKRGWHDRQPFLFGADWCNLEEDLDGRTAILKLTQIDMA